MSQGACILHSVVSRLRSQARVSEKIERITERDGPGCFYCECDFSRTARRTLDHRVPTVGGGTNRTDNLRLSCANCNKKKANRSEEAFVATRWLALRRHQVERERSRGGKLPGRDRPAE